MVVATSVIRNYGRINAPGFDSNYEKINYRKRERLWAGEQVVITAGAKNHVHTLSRPVQTRWQGLIIVS